MKYDSAGEHKTIKLILAAYRATIKIFNDLDKINSIIDFIDKFIVTPAKDKKLNNDKSPIKNRINIYISKLDGNSNTKEAINKLTDLISRLSDDPKGKDYLSNIISSANLAVLSLRDLIVEINHSIEILKDQEVKNSLDKKYPPQSSKEISVLRNKIINTLSTINNNIVNKVIPSLKNNSDDYFAYIDGLNKSLEQTATDINSLYRGDGGEIYHSIKESISNIEAAQYKMEQFPPIIGYSKYYGSILTEVSSCMRNIDFSIKHLSEK